MSNEFAQGYLFGLGTAIVVFIVGFVVLPFIIGFVQGLWRKWKNRNKPEQDWDPVGYIEKVSLTDEGLEVTARLNEGFHGADFITKDALKGLSIGMEGMPIRDRTGYPGYLILDDGEEPGVDRARSERRARPRHRVPASRRPDRRCADAGNKVRLPSAEIE